MSYKCETHLPFYKETWLDFLPRVWADFLPRAIEQLSFPKTADGVVGQFTLVSRDPKHLFTFSDQYERGTGEFLSESVYVFDWIEYSSIHSNIEQNTLIIKQQQNINLNDVYDNHEGWVLPSPIGTSWAVRWDFSGMAPRPHSCKLD